MSTHSVAPRWYKAWRRAGRRFGRRIAKVDRYEWQAWGCGWIETAGMAASPLVAIAVWQATGQMATAFVVAFLVAVVTSNVAHRAYPELDSDRRAQMQDSYEKGYRRGIRDERREANLDPGP